VTFGDGRASPVSVTRGIVVFAALTLPLVVAACLPPDSRGQRDGGGSTGNDPIGAIFAATPTPTSTPAGPSPSPSFVRPTPTPAPTFMVYTVASGDNLNTIAHKFGTTARSLAYWNRATYPSLDPESSEYQPGLVRVGWTLQLIPNLTVDEQALPDPSEAT